MKNNKLLTSLFVLGMGLSLVACGASDGGTTTKTDGTKTVERGAEVCRTKRIRNGRSSL